MLTGLILTILFFIYRYIEVIPRGPLDKVIQFFLLIPAIVCFAFCIAGSTDHDLVKLIMCKIGKLSSVRFLGLLLIILSIFSVWMVYGPLEGIPKGVDEAAYFFQSKIYASGYLAAPAPDVDNPMTYFPFRHFVFRDNLWFIVYTPFHSLLMAPFTAAGAAPLLGPIEGLLSLIGIFLLVRLWAGEMIARISSILLLLSPFFLFMTTTFMAHNTNLLLITWSLYMISRRVKGGSVSYGLAGGFLLGLAFTTKPYPVLVWLFFIPLAVVVGCRGRWLRILAPVAAAAAVPFSLFLLSNSYYTGNPLHAGYDLVRGGKLIGFGPDKAWFPEYGDYAHTPLRGLLNVVRQMGNGSTIMFGWPFLSLFPMLLALGYSRIERRVLWLYLPLILIMFLMLLHYYPAIDYGPRHYFTFLPIIMLLSALGLREAVRYARERKGIEGSNAVAVAVLFLFMITLFIYIPEGIELRSGPLHTIDRQAEIMACGSVETPATVFMQAGQLGYPNFCSGMNYNSPFLDEEIIYCAHQTPEEDLQFMQAYPGRNPYLYWFDGHSFHIEPWTQDRSETIEPTRNMKYYAYLYMSDSAEVHQ